MNSGLLGVSGVSSDFRDVLEEAETAMSGRSWRPTCWNISW